MKTIKIFIIVSLILLARGANAQSTVIDLRNDISYPKHWVGIVITDYSKTGHAFVVLGKENPEKALTELAAVRGFYKDPEGWIAGKVENDFWELRNVQNADQIYFIVEEKDYESAVQVVNEWISSPSVYHVIFNNCIDLTQKVADAIGVDLPLAGITSFTPKRYLDKIKTKLTDEGLNYRKGSKIIQFENGTYNGPLVNGFPHGKGILVNKNSVYKGEFKNGVRTKGTLKTDNEVYDGEFKNGVYNGTGKRVTDRYIYTGKFNNGKPNGKGVLLDRVNNSTLQGVFIEGKIDGKVTRISDSGKERSTYTIKNENYVSPTEIKYHDGAEETVVTDNKGTRISSIYKSIEGTEITVDYQDGKPYKAHYKFKDGKEIKIDKFYDVKNNLSFGTIKTNDFTYTGDLKSLQFHGKGVLLKGGVKWEGDFTNGRPEGKVRVIRSDFDFTGQIWYDDNHSYQNGTIIFVNGATYQGDLRNYIIHGNGIYKHTEEERFLFIKLKNNRTTIYKDFDSEKAASVMAPLRPVSISASFPDNSLFKDFVPIPSRDPINDYESNSTIKTDFLDYYNLDDVPVIPESSPILKRNSPQYFKDPITGKRRLL